jgi:hypothetical protein
MHQSAVRSPRALAESGCCWSGRQRRPLPFLRRLPTQRAAAARSAVAYAAAFAHHAPARPAPALNQAHLLEIAFPSLETRPTLRTSSAAISASRPRTNGSKRPTGSTPSLSKTAPWRGWVVLRGCCSRAKASVEAVRQWRYSPIARRFEPVEVDAAMPHPAFVAANSDSEKLRKWPWPGRNRKLVRNEPELNSRRGLFRKSPRR